MRLGMVVGLAVAGGACARNVSQDARSGPDRRAAGAEEMRFENNAATATGIVTYPGEDRVDWKAITLPDERRATLVLELTWEPPRPGLQLAFDVFDEAKRKVVGRRGPIKPSRRRIRTATIPDARGRYFIRVYAVGRGDAGTYRLTAEMKGIRELPLSLLEIPDPPTLAAVPVPPAVCTDESFDPEKPECKAYCPTPPDVSIAACREVMECPRPPDARIKKCHRPFPRCSEYPLPGDGVPRCKPTPVLANVVGTSIVGDELQITIGAGMRQGIAKSWRGVVLLGSGDTALPGGELTLVRVDPKLSIARVRLTVEQVTKNPRVKLSPP